METQDLLVKILTQENSKLSSRFAYAELPGLQGCLGIGPNHMDLMAELKPGQIKLSKSGNKNSFESVFFVSGGFFQVNNKELLVLADLVESPDEVDIIRAKKSQERAESRLRDQDKSSVDFERAQRSLDRSIARQAVKELRK